MDTVLTVLKMGEEVNDNLIHTHIPQTIRSPTSIVQYKKTQTKQLTTKPHHKKKPQNWKSHHNSAKAI